MRSVNARKTFCDRSTRIITFVFACLLVIGQLAVLPVHVTFGTTEIHVPVKSLAKLSTGIIAKANARQLRISATALLLNFETSK